MRSEAEVSEAVFRAVMTVTRRDRSALAPDTRLIRDLGMESIDTIDLLFEIERGLNISVNLADIFQNQLAVKARVDQFDMEIGEIVTYISGLVRA